MERSSRSATRRLGGNWLESGCGSRGRRTEGAASLRCQLSALLGRWAVLRRVVNKSRRGREPCAQLSPAPDQLTRSGAARCARWNALRRCRVAEAVGGGDSSRAQDQHSGQQKTDDSTHRLPSTMSGHLGPGPSLRANARTSRVGCYPLAVWEPSLLRPGASTSTQQASRRTGHAVNRHDVVIVCRGRFPARPRKRSPARAIWCPESR
jgi:hypothetical protein